MKRMAKRGLAWLLAALCQWSAWPLGAHALSVSAASAVLYEPTGGTVLFERQANQPRAMASTTKLMTALLAAETDDWTREVTVTSAMTAVEGSSMGLRPSDRVTLYGLVCGLLLASGNDAANAIALTLAGSLEAFAERMNRKAAQLGLQNTHFVTPSGLDADTHYSTAFDLAKLGAAVLQNPVLAAVCAEKQMTVEISGRTVWLSNHNRLLRLYPDAVGLKTGYTQKAGRCLVSAARRDGVTLIAVTLQAPDDWQDHITLLEYGFTKVTAVTLPTAETGALPVIGGTQNAVPTVAASPPSVVVPTGREDAVTATVYRSPFRFAPVCSGETVGRVDYRLDGRLLATVPITAAHTVEVRARAGFGRQFWRRVCAMLRGLLCGNIEETEQRIV